jgi:uncharacterized protein
MDCDLELPPDVEYGIQFFNRGMFFEAHEALETAWRAEHKPNRNLYQGILQLGVGYYHLMNNNFVGAKKLFLRAEKTLDGIPSYCQGIDVDLIRLQIKEAENLVECIKSNPFLEFHFPIYQIETGQINHG